MDKVEARRLLAQHLATYRARPYVELVTLVGTNWAVEVRGPSGADYEIELEVRWDSTPDKKNIRVMGSIDDGRLPGALVPICEDFILSPAGTFFEE